MFFQSVPIPELLYAVFGLCDNALTTACLVWLCWQFPVLGQRPLRALFIAALLLLGTPLVVAFGYCFSRMELAPHRISHVWAWNFLWTVTGTPFVILTMALIRRVKGIVVTNRSLTIPSRQAISIRDLLVWTLVVALVFASTGAASSWLQDALRFFGAPFSGSAAIGTVAFNALILGVSTYLLLPILSSSIWYRAVIAYAIYLMGQVAYLALLSSSGNASAIPSDFWFVATIRGVSTTAGIVLGHRLLMRRGYQYQLRPKLTIHTTPR